MQLFWSWDKSRSLCIDLHCTADEWRRDQLCLLLNLYITIELYKGDRYFTDAQTDTECNKELAQVFHWSSIKVKARKEDPMSWLSFVRTTLSSEMRVHEHNRFSLDHVLV